MQEQINIGDFIIIQLLKYLNIDLYDTIYKNSTFFISEDRNLCTNYNDEYYWTDKFNQVAKEFYTSLLEKNKNKDYKNILSTLFPYIDNYIKGYEIRTTIPFNHNQDIYNEILDKKTCGFCKSRDGEILPLKDVKFGVNAPPFHPYCRGFVEFI